MTNLNIESERCYAMNEEEFFPRTMPIQKPGSSKQNYGTPREFIQAVENRFGKLICDLAASKENTKCEKFFDEKDNSLNQNWAELYPENNLWLNPPFGGIGVWAKKCYEESQKRQGLILFLTPASVGTNWFYDYVHQKAMVLALSPRLVFEGETSSFPKDLMLSCYGMGLKGFDVWKWK